MLPKMPGEFIGLQMVAIMELVGLNQFLFQQELL
jgi:hypothetical protein